MTTARVRVAPHLVAAAVAAAMAAAAGCGGGGGDQRDADAPLLAAVQQHVTDRGEEMTFLTGSTLVDPVIDGEVRAENVDVVERTEIAARAEATLVARVRFRPGPPDAPRLGRMVPPAGGVSRLRLRAVLELGLDNEGMWAVVDDDVDLDAPVPIASTAQREASDHATAAIRALLTLDPSIRDVRYVDVQAPFYATVPEDRGDYDTESAIGLTPVPDLGGDETHTTLGRLDGTAGMSGPVLLDDLLLASNGEAPSPNLPCTLELRRMHASRVLVERTTNETRASSATESVKVDGTVDVRAGTYHCPDAAAQSTNHLVFSVTVERARFAGAPWRVVRLTLRNPDAELSGEAVIYE